MLKNCDSLIKEIKSVLLNKIYDDWCNKVKSAKTIAAKVSNMSRLMSIAF